MRLGRKTTGGKYHARRKKRFHEGKGQELKVALGEPRAKTIRGRGNTLRQRLLRSNIANVSDGKKIEKAEIKTVVQTPQNVFFARQNVLFKGAVIDTSKGKAKITNRPTREGFINAILIKE